MSTISLDLFIIDINIMWERIKGLPFIRPMANVSAVAGEPLYIACPVAGYPIDAITWEKDGRPLPLNRRQQVFENGTLLLENVQRDPDRGEYRCTASNKQGRSATQTLPLNVIVPPRIAPFSFQTDLHLGDRAGVQCFITKGDLPLTIGWRKDGAAIQSDVGVAQTGDFTSSLSIASLRPHHAGQYTCTATNLAAHAAHSSTLLVNVPPRWVSEPRDVNVTRDESALFHCQADGFPTPTHVWRKVVSRQPSEYRDLSVRSRGIQLFPNGTLLIRQALPEHQGQYLCEASNAIGAGLSIVVTLNVHVPPEFEVKSAQASVRRGAPESLQCLALGDAPMSVTWQREGARHSEQLNPRYEVKESVLKGGFLSELHISSTVKSDSGTFTCVARNPYGRADRTLHLQVQDAPGKPLDLRVIEHGSRTVKLTWLSPADNSSPVLQYVVQYQQDSLSALSEGWQSVPGGTEPVAVVTGLQPATVYRLHVLAENELGAGEPSEPIVVRTEGEPPSGEPQNLVVSATSSEQLRLVWSPPPLHTWHGDLLGYYVGYRQHGLSRLGGYNFTTVNAGPGGPGLATLSRLKKFRKYGVVVQAFNEKGPGPMSSEVVQATLEDVPSAPPLEVHCSAQSAQSVALNWQPPAQLAQNGHIKGYKVYYENTEEWPPGFIEAEIKVTTELNTELHGLQKYSNYSIQVWAYTSVGDGVKSAPIFCLTDEDVPDAPSHIKVVAMSPAGLVVAWTAPERPNGRLVSYTVYTRATEAGRERDSSKRRLPPSHTHYEVHDLRRGESYEFWVTAHTRVGEGQSTAVVYSTISNRVPAAIISFGQPLSGRRRGSLVLPCLAVGLPAPERVWLSADGAPISAGDSLSVQADGSLHIADIQRSHHTNYTCSVANPNGSDQIVYSVSVLGSPGSPAMRVASSGSDWLQLQWAPVESGGSALRGYLLNYRQDDDGEWEERSISREATYYRLRELACGTEYLIQLIAFNSVGSSAPSATLVASTDGGKPTKPESLQLIETNSSCITLRLKAWPDNGCSITSFSVEYRELSRQEWLTVGNNIPNTESLVIGGLWPGTQYVVRVGASNSAGHTSGDYPLSTLSLAGGTVSPDVALMDSEPSLPYYLDTSFILPVFASLIFLVAITLAICVCFKRKVRSREQLGRNDPQAMVALDNEHNMAQREQYYAAVHKGLGTHSVERIPEYAEDISPYATFHVPSHQQPTSSPGHIQTFVYHDHRLAAMETMQLKSTNPREEYSKVGGNVKNKCAHSESSDYSGHRMVDHRQSIHNILYPAGGTGGPESSTSPEASPVPDRRNVARRHRHHAR